LPIDKLGQVADKVAQLKRLPQCEAIIFAAQLIGDDSKVLGQAIGERAEQIDAARQTGHQNDWRPVAKLRDM